ncbi:uncharacterized protein LOC132925501 [Rhopalosiphum padi]|uniref:uncharacterized protein LOC132925501 n=1 Tax=Rhopalosiphum padi TaxID=40932 RepID=UPI00298DE46F|nr:uncharacterized protein LOC132925501 [Rhopalosiphum padi]
MLDRVIENIELKMIYYQIIVDFTKTYFPRWLIVTSKYQNFDDADVVLQHMLRTINIIEQIEERTLCIAHAYLAVSQYHYTSMAFNEAWFWAVKAILELHEDSGVLKIMVISHAIRVSAFINKINIARRLLEQINVSHNMSISCIHNINMMWNIAYYFNILEYTDEAIKQYYITLNSARNVFGYYNLNTAMVLAEYALAYFNLSEPSVENGESVWCILQALSIMSKIGIPENNMFLKNACLIKSLILGETALLQSFDSISDGKDRVNMT